MFKFLFKKKPVTIPRLKGVTTKDRTPKPSKDKRNLETREQWFMENSIQCSCLMGYVICQECHKFYNKN